MLNFAVGPVQEPEYVLRAGANPTPYFRNTSFSNIMLENEQMMKELAFAPQNAKAVFLTASGTGAMEAAVINSFSAEDKVLAVNGGSFGQRFVQICRTHGIFCQEIAVPLEEDLTGEMLAPFEDKGYTGFLVNMGETSVGKLYDMQLISEFCKRNRLFLIVDAISSFLADPFHMERLGADIMLTGSQKALAVPPGVSILLFSPEAVSRIMERKVQSVYFDLADALRNMERGQTPFTPAVGTMLQLHVRLKQLIADGGAERENKRIAALAADFRGKIQGLPLRIAVASPSNAVTPLLVEGISAYEVFERLEAEFGIWVCPNGGNLRDTLFRVGHMGDLRKEDNDKLIEALKQSCGKCLDGIYCT